MALTTEQLAEINDSNRDQITLALNRLTGAKRFAHYIESENAQQLETALRARLEQLRIEEDQALVKAAVDAALAIVNESDDVV